MPRGKSSALSQKSCQHHCHGPEMCVLTSMTFHDVTLWHHTSFSSMKGFACRITQTVCRFSYLSAKWAKFWFPFFVVSCMCMKPRPWAMHFVSLLSCMKVSQTVNQLFHSGKFSYFLHAVLKSVVLVLSWLDLWLEFFMIHQFKNGCSNWVSICKWFLMWMGLVIC